MPDPRWGTSFVMGFSYSEVPSDITYTVNDVEIPVAFSGDPIDIADSLGFPVPTFAFRYTPSATIEGNPTWQAEPLGQKQMFDATALTSLRADIDEETVTTKQGLLNLIDLLLAGA